MNDLSGIQILYIEDSKTHRECVKKLIPKAPLGRRPVHASANERSTAYKGRVKQEKFALFIANSLYDIQKGRVTQKGMLLRPRNPIKDSIPKHLLSRCLYLGPL
jgi:hypothetical protein